MKHWVFDLDCTLVESGNTFDRTIKRILQHFNPATSERTLEDAARKARDYFEIEEFFGFYLKEDQIDEAVELLLRFDDEAHHEIVCFNGIPELLEDLHGWNIELSIWTGRDLNSTQKLLVKTGIGRFFARIATRTCVERTKPAPDGLIKILSESKHRGDDVVMIGDHEYDIKGARAAGVKAYSVSWGEPAPHPLEKISDKHFYQVEDLKKFAFNLYGRP